MATPSESLTELVEETVPDISELTAPSVDLRKIGGLEVREPADQDPYLTCLFYGQPGAGKTVLAGSASEVEEMCPVILVDVEGGTFSLRSRHPNVDVVRTKTWMQMQAVYNELYKGRTGYKTVILDSLTEIQRLSMLGIMVDVIKKEPERDAEVPSIREWGKNGEQTRRMVRAFRDLPMNTIFTALVIDEKDEKSGKRKYRPSLSGKMSGEVSGYVDLCAYLYTMPKDDKICRFLLTGSLDTHVAKDRSDSLPMLLEEPSMTKIHEYIFPTKE